MEKCASLMILGIHMDEEEYINYALESFDTLNEYTEPMIEAIMQWAREGTTLDWFLVNWPEVVRSERDLTPDEEAAIAPWIKTWAEEAFKRVEKEKQ